jgi:sugar phosphate isomerase/epimerase
MNTNSVLRLACHISAFALPSAAILDESLGTAARLGFRFVDVSLAHIDAKRAMIQPQSEAANLRSALTEFNLTLTNFDLSLPTFNAPDPAARESALDQFQKLLPFLAALRVPGVTLSAGAIHDDGTEHSLARSVAGLLTMHRLAATEAPDLQLSILLQPETTAEQPTDALRLLDCVPGLQLTVDTGHCAYLGLARKDMVPLLNRASHIRVRQGSKNRVQTLFEAGKLDLRDLVEDVLELGYNGALSVAYVTKAGDFGAVKFDPIDESLKTRDALRNARLSVQRG